MKHSERVGTMKPMGMDSTGVAILHRPSGKEFGLCHDHQNDLDDTDGVVPMGPLFTEFTCIVCAQA